MFHIKNDVNTTDCLFSVKHSCNDTQLINVVIRQCCRIGLCYLNAIIVY